jgi:hypothetical protein
MALAGMQAVAKNYLTTQLQDTGRSSTPEHIRISAGFLALSESLASQVDEPPHAEMYVLPDLLTALTSGPNGASGQLSGLEQPEVGDSRKQLLEELFFLSCTAGSQAVLQPKVEVTAAAMHDLLRG